MSVKGRARTIAARLVLTTLGATVASATPSAAQARFDGILRLFDTQTQTEGDRSNAYGGTLDVRYQQEVTETASYLFSVRSVYSSQEQPLTDPRLNDRNRQIEPRLELRLRPRWFTFSIGQRWLRARSRSDIEDVGSGVTREEDNLYARFQTRLDRGPQGLVEYDRRALRSPGVSDNVNDRLFLQLGYLRDTWSASIGRRNTTNDAGVTSLRRKTVENLLAANLNRTFAEGRGSITANYNLTDLETRDRLPSESLVPIQRQVRRGLAALDPIPADGPLDNEPALTDGNRSTPTQVNIGGSLAGGALGWNIGAELVTGEFVDLVDVWLAAPITQESAARYRWAVYSSADNSSWALVSGDAGRTYDLIDGRFRINFPATTSRFLKVVNIAVDPLQGSVFVSELEFFGQELRRGTSVTTTRSHNAAAFMTWSPQPYLTTTAGFNASDVSNRQQSQSAIDVRNFGVNTGLTLTPSPIFTAALSLLQNWREQSLVTDQKDTLVALTLTALPVRDLDLSLAASRTRQSRGGQVAVVEAFNFRVGTLLYRDLSASAEYGEATEESLDAPDRFRRTLRAALTMRPRQEIEFTTDATAERILIPSVPAPQDIQRNVLWNNRLSVRPSPILVFTLQGTYFRVPSRKGWSRVVQGDWSPFPGGALQLSIDYREDVPLGGQRRVLRSARIHWTINRKMFFDFEVARLRLDSTVPVPTEEARTLVSAFLQARI